MSYARDTDPDTSQDAADSISIQYMEGLVMDAVAKFGAATSQEVAAVLSLSRDSVSPRIAALCRKGLMRDSGARRKGPSGRYSTLWKLV
jgi:predicted HTH transcriptional regulator